MGYQLMIYKIDGVAVTEIEFITLDIGCWDITYGEETLAVTNPSAINGYRKLQARTYLLATDFKAQAGTLTTEQTAIRDKAKLLLEGSFIEPDSELFNV